MRELLEAYVIPQMQGRADLHEGVDALLSGSLGAEAAVFERRLAVWTGYIAPPEDDRE